MHTSQMWQLNTASECIDVAIVNYGMLVTSILCTAWLHCKQLHKPSLAWDICLLNTLNEKMHGHITSV